MQSPLLADAERQRYARHLSLAEVGLEGQARLKAGSVLVVGAGGLGSPAALYLAAAGVGRLGLVDFDRVDLSNLQRQVLFDTGSIGEPKSTAARDRLAALNPEIRIDAHQQRLTARTIGPLFADYDVIVDGTDRLGVRYLVNDACVLMGKPLVSAAIHRFEGQAMTYVPGKSPCYRCLYPNNAEDLVPNCATAGVLGVLPGVMGTLQATEAVKLLLGIGETLAGRLLLYDALGLRFQEFRFARRADCAVCGDSPTITTLHDPAPEDSVPALEEWSARQLAQRLETPGAAPVLVDVREDHEVASGMLPNALHIPLGQLPARFGEIPPGDELVFICAGGFRSANACRFARESGPQRHQSGGRHERLARRARLSGHPRRRSGVALLLMACAASGCTRCSPSAQSGVDPVVSAANALRSAGCDGRQGTSPPLTRDRALDDVARRWASQGGSGRLDVALESVGVRARQSASLALVRGGPDDAASGLRDRLCAELTTAEWTRLGWYSDSGGLWIVITVPSQPPARADAPAVSATALRLANAFRAKGARCGSKVFGPAPAADARPRARARAQVQADEMAKFQFLAHEGRDGSTPAERATRAGYEWRVVGENVAAGPESAEEVMRGWEQSPDHCRNLMDSDFTGMGLAYAASPRTTGHSTWWSTGAGPAPALSLSAGVRQAIRPQARRAPELPEGCVV